MATGATPNLALPYPVPTDPNNVPADVQSLATQVEGVFISQGLFANRPAAGHKGAWYFSTDKEWVSRDDGSAWHDFQSVADANADYVAKVLGSGDSFAATGLTGSTAASRYVGATASGAPTTGAHLLGDFVIDQTGAVWICTTAGTPGTWAQSGGAPVNVSNLVAANETRTATTYGALTTAGPAVTVTVPASGRLLVTLSGFVGNDTSGQSSVMSFALSGDNTAAANDSQTLGYVAPASVAGQGMRASYVVLLTGLTAGSTTLTAQYRVTGGTGTFGQRQIIAEPR